MSYIQSNSVIELPAAAITLSPVDSGKIFTVSQAAAYIITLPAYKAGICYKFITRAAGGNVVQIAVPGAATTIFGNSISGPLAAATVRVGAGTNTVQFSTTCVVGDTINMTCDGSRWYAAGSSGSVAGATSIIFV